MSVLVGQLQVVWWWWASTWLEWQQPFVTAAQGISTQALWLSMICAHQLGRVGSCGAPASRWPACR